MTKKERLEAIMAHYADGKTSVMASKLGVADSTISTWLKRDTYDLELLFAKCENISAEWLITGEGEMIVSKSLVDVADLREIIDYLKQNNTDLRGEVENLRNMNEELQSNLSDALNSLRTEQQKASKKKSTYQYQYSYF